MTFDTPSKHTKPTVTLFVLLLKYAHIRVIMTLLACHVMARVPVRSPLSPKSHGGSHMCFGGRKTREERKICLKIRLFGFPQTLVYRPATTAAHKVVSTLIGPFEFERALTTRPSTAARAQIQMDQSELRVKPPCEWPLSRACFYLN